MEFLCEAADDVRVDDGSAVGAAVVQTARGVIIGTARFLEGSVIGDHGVDTAGGDPPKKARFAQAADIEVSFWVRLGDDAHLETGIQQDPADDGGSDEGAVDVGIAGDQDDIQAIPAKSFYFLDCCWEEHGRIIIAIL